MGIICALGGNVEECFSNAVKGISGISRTESVDTKGCYADLSAEVRESFFGDDGEDCEKDRAVRLALKAVKEAIKDSGHKFEKINPRVSVVTGSCVGGVRSGERYFRYLKDNPGYRFCEKEARELIGEMPIAVTGRHIAEICKAGGAVSCIANACAAGTIAIIEACNLIKEGKADITVVCGTDAFASVPYAGFLALHALDEKGCSPFNRSGGITLGEGAGALIIESAEYAEKRKAKIYCEVVGSGISSDAFDITAPAPDGEGQIAAMKIAINEAGAEVSRIGYVNAHGTGTAKNDTVEMLSLCRFFGGNNENVSVSSTKSMTGHCLGAAGAIEAVLSIKAFNENVVLPTIGFTEEEKANLSDKAGKTDFPTNVGKRKKLEYVMSNSFAFGGNNASIIFGKKGKSIEEKKSEKTKTVITGIGTVLPDGNGKEKYVEICKGYNGAKKENDTGANCGYGEKHSSVAAEDYTEYGLKTSFYRKLDEIGKFQVISGLEALKDAGKEINGNNAERAGIVVGTSEGAMGTGSEFQKNIIEKGNACGSAFKFPNTVYNAAGGHFSICSGIKGYNVTVSSGPKSGLESVIYAVTAIRRGKADFVVASGADEGGVFLKEFYREMGFTVDKRNGSYGENRGFVLSDGCVSMVIEKETDAENRGKRAYCAVLGGGFGNHSVGTWETEESVKGLETAVKNALTDAEVTNNDIDAIAGFACGDKIVDGQEWKAYREIFGERMKKLPVLCVKERTGEGRAATAALACAHAAMCLAGEIKYDDCAFTADENGKAKRITANTDGMKHILVTGYSPGGSYCAVVLGKKEG